MVIEGLRDVEEVMGVMVGVKGGWVGRLGFRMGFLSLFYFVCFIY